MDDMEIAALGKAVSNISRENTARQRRNKNTALDCLSQATCSSQRLVNMPQRDLISTGRAQCDVNANRESILGVQHHMWVASRQPAVTGTISLTSAAENTCADKASGQDVKAFTPATGNREAHGVDYMTRLPKELIMHIAHTLPSHSYNALRATCRSLRDCLISVDAMHAQLQNGACNGTLRRSYEKWVNEKNVHELLSELPAKEASALLRTQAAQHPLFPNTLQLKAEHPALVVGEQHDLNRMYRHFYDVFKRYEMELRRASPQALFDAIFHISSESRFAARNFYPEVLCREAINFSNLRRLDDIVACFARAQDYWHSATLKEQVFLSVAMWALKGFWCCIPPGDHRAEEVERALQPYSMMITRGRYALDALGAMRPELIEHRPGMMPTA